MRFCSELSGVTEGGKERSPDACIYISWITMAISSGRMNCPSRW
jgi:hypothetical protein